MSQAANGDYVRVSIYRVRHAPIREGRVGTNLEAIRLGTWNAIKDQVIVGILEVDPIIDLKAGEEEKGLGARTIRMAAEI
ncbi:hypothetical protein P7K49_004891, partial [Saguinus oedipus]